MLFHAIPFYSMAFHANGIPWLLWNYPHGGRAQTGPEGIQVDQAQVCVPNAYPVRSGFAPNQHLSPGSLSCCFPCPPLSSTSPSSSSSSPSSPPPPPSSSSCPPPPSPSPFIPSYSGKAISCYSTSFHAIPRKVLSCYSR